MPLLTAQVDTDAAVPNSPFGFSTNQSVGDRAAVTRFTQTCPHVIGREGRRLGGDRNDGLVRCVIIENGPRVHLRGAARTLWFGRDAQRRFDACTQIKINAVVVKPAFAKEFPQQVEARECCALVDEQILLG